MGKFKIGDKVKYVGDSIKYKNFHYTVVDIRSYGFIKCYCEELGYNVEIVEGFIELIEDYKPKYNFKYNVGDKVMLTNGSIHTISSRKVYYNEDKKMSLRYTLNGKSNNAYFSEDVLTLVESVNKPTYVDDLKRFNEKLSKDIESDKLTNDLDVKEKVDMKKLSDIRIGSKIVTIPQHNAAPKKVECKTVIVTLDGKDYESVCMPEDEFNLERGIEVCILKSIFGSTQKYNKYIRKTVSFYNDCEKKRAEEDRIKAKREKEIARQKARKERIAEKARKARVDEMSEAFFNAMKSYDASITDKERNDRIAMDVDKIVNVFASKGLINMPNNTVDNSVNDDLK